jgi:hypothetical protein|tara:strand:- start:174 stop:485 length:312 start_codon:yes stop_codon:yes gene_type:complete
MSEETNEFLDRSDLDFVRDVLIDALDQKREDLVPRIFKLYEELRAPAPTIPTGNIDISTLSAPAGSEYNFSLTSDYLGEVGAAAEVDLSGLGNDVISFGDYKS